MKELKCLVCGADIEVVEDTYTSYETGENGNLDVVITSTGYCTKCNEEHIWNERYTFKGYENIERVED